MHTGQYLGGRPAGPFVAFAVHLFLRRGQFGLIIKTREWAKSLLSLGLVNVLAGRYFHDIADEFEAECGVVVHRTPCPSFSSEVEAHFLSLD
jgi:hypothetical protein